MKLKMGSGRSKERRSQNRNIRSNARKRRVSPRFQNLFEVEEDGKEFVFTAMEIWMRAVCDAYLRATPFPAATRREYYGYTDHKGIYHPPIETPYLIDGKPVLDSDGNPFTITRDSQERDFRPGAVWMTRKLFSSCFTDVFHLDADPEGYRKKLERSDEMIETLGVGPMGRYAMDVDPSRTFYHPSEPFFRRVAKKYLFTPHTIESARHMIAPIEAEMFAKHRTLPNGRMPKSTGQFMIQPEILDRINRSDVYDVFRERRAAFNIEKLSAKRNERMWTWKDILLKLEHFPVFDRETVVRMTADPEVFGEPSNPHTIDTHLERWRRTKSKGADDTDREARIERVRYGLYRPRRQAFHDYDVKENYLVDWFYEFMRRQAFRQQVSPDAFFTFNGMMEDIRDFHPDWQKFHGTIPDAHYARMRLNRETKGYGDGKGTWIEKVTTYDRRLTQEALDLFCPEDVEDVMWERSRQKRQREMDEANRKYQVR
ncbi:hypothetical protein KEU06_09305 [Pseudaminobacter sp. 19-2017]|uniref:Uncharacterized protein n=1 Tax=Pseudaminobacter soli (ex Zhang et al. 2022) TaxID=2831468 RepID=A0A942I907_9HYPH|nr:hypothetical protein [Pseudaminobacter soli]MBS3648801.1 hypothetical protein [Pseudaminobacter soli]